MLVAQPLNDERFCVQSFCEQQASDEPSSCGQLACELLSSARWFSELSSCEQWFSVRLSCEQSSYELLAYEPLSSA